MPRRCTWREVTPGIFAPGCMGGVVTDTRLILRPHYDYCPFCGSRAKYGPKNDVTDRDVKRVGKIQRIGLQPVSKPFEL